MVWEAGSDARVQPCAITKQICTGNCGLTHPGFLCPPTTPSSLGKVFGFSTHPLKVHSSSTPLCRGWGCYSPNLCKGEQRSQSRSGSNPAPAPRTPPPSSPERRDGEPGALGGHRPGCRPEQHPGRVLAPAACFAGAARGHDGRRMDPSRDTDTKMIKMCRSNFLDEKNLNCLFFFLKAFLQSLPIPKKNEEK